MIDKNLIMVRDLCFIRKTMPVLFIYLITTSIMNLKLADFGKLTKELKALSFERY